MRRNNSVSITIKQIIAIIHPLIVIIPIITVIIAQLVEIISLLCPNLNIGTSKTRKVNYHQIKQIKLINQSKQINQQENKDIQIVLIKIYKLIHSKDNFMKT